jgi:ligand-binding SRPBCC domain-containing protein
VLTIERTSTLAAPAETVWCWVTTPQGINDELRPWLRMTRPTGVYSLADVRPGVPLGRSWILLLGVMPIDADDLTIVQIAPGRFLERSRLLSAPVWEHERTVTERAGGCELHDRVSFEPRAAVRRLPGGARLHTAILGAIFTHRHRRLRRRFGS